MRIINISGLIGANITDCDVNELKNEEFEEIYRAWLSHCVVVFNHQKVTPAQLVYLARRFGDLEMPPASENQSRGDSGSAKAKEMWVVSNVIENGKHLGALGAGEAAWHSDMTYLPVPPTASILYGHEIPAGQADTCFANMYSALEFMPTKLRYRIEGHFARHDSSYTSVGEVRKGMEEVVDVTKAPGAKHPLIIKHPETRRLAVFPGRRLNAYIEGLPVNESELLLDELWDWCVQEKFVYVHKWKEGDIVIWDNRSTLHRRDSFDETFRRILWRCQVKGKELRTVA